jgi:hypothetical protein
VPTDLGHFDELLRFRRFRFNVIGFLRLPLGVSENGLRDVMKTASVNLLASYDARAVRARSVFRSRSSSRLPDQAAVARLSRATTAADFPSTRISKP